METTPICRACLKQANNLLDRVYVFTGIVVLPAPDSILFSFLTSKTETYG